MTALASRPNSFHSSSNKKKVKPKMNNRTPQVHCVVICPYVKQVGTDIVVDNSIPGIKPSDVMMSETTKEIIKIANRLKTPERPVRLLCSPWAKYSAIKNMISYLAQQKGKRYDTPATPRYIVSLANDMKVKPGDFVFIFIYCHGSYILTHRSNDYDFDSNKYYENRLKKGENITAFLPKTTTLYKMPAQPDLRRHITQNYSISMKSFPKSYVDNASSRKKPYISIADTNEYFNLMIVEEAGAITDPYSRALKSFRLQKATIYEEGKNPQTFTFFYRYRRDTTGKDEFYISTASPNCAFGELPPAGCSPSYSWANTKEQVPTDTSSGTKTETKSFTAADLASSIQDATTNLFIAADTCYCGALSYISPQAEISYSIWCSTSPDSVSWANGKTHLSYFFKCLNDATSTHPDKSYYQAIRNAVFAKTRESVWKNSFLIQEPQYRIFGTTEFDGTESRHKRFPHNGVLLR